MHTRPSCNKHRCQRAPKAQPFLSPGQRPGYRVHYQSSPERASPILSCGPHALIPHISLIKLEAVSGQQFSKFILERHRPMMCLLLLDVANDLGLLGFTNGKSPIPRLPGESHHSLLFHPPGRCSFDFLNNAAHRQGSRLCEQDVHMIRHAACLQRRTLHLAKDSHEVAVKGGTYLLVNPRLPVLGAEHQVNQDLG